MSGALSGKQIILSSFPKVAPASTELVTDSG
jgi:hypothetical protein